jgi:predicted negative regulator of RcsB-dependent stress response
VEYQQTDQEQIEEIKKWWKDNGTSVLTGVILGLTLLFGWQGWHQYQASEAEHASNTYEQAIAALEHKEKDKIASATDELLSKYSSSPYAALLALHLAKADVEENKLESAQLRLQWVIDNAKLLEFAHVARLRLVRIAIAQQQFDKAFKLASHSDQGTFKGEYAELRGDIASLQGNKDAARTAYTDALASKDISNSVQALLKLKLDELGSNNGSTKARPPTVTEAVATPSTPAKAAAIELPKVGDVVATPSTAAAK